MKLKKGNVVKILTGKDKNKSGEVIEINRYLNRAKVKGINIVKKHVKTTKENFIHISNLKIENKKEDKKIKKVTK